MFSGGVRKWEFRGRGRDFGFGVWGIWMIEELGVRDIEVERRRGFMGVSFSYILGVVLGFLE